MSKREARVHIVCRRCFVHAAGGSAPCLPPLSFACDRFFGTRWRSASRATAAVPRLAMAVAPVGVRAGRRGRGGCGEPWRGLAIGTWVAVFDVRTACPDSASTGPTGCTPSRARRDRPFDRHLAIGPVERCCLACSVGGGWDGVPGGWRAWRSGVSEQSLVTEHDLSQASARSPEWLCRHPVSSDTARRSMCA